MSESIPAPVESSPQPQGGEYVDPLTNLAIAASLRHGTEVLGIADTKGVIDGSMLRSDVFGQAEVRPLLDVTPQLTPEFMKQRRSVMLEHAGVDAQAQVEFADVLEHVGFRNEAGILKDPIEHILLGDFEIHEIPNEATGEMTTVVELGGIHHLPTALKFHPENSMSVTKDKTKEDVKNRAKTRGVTKAKLQLEGYVKPVSTAFPETASPTDILGWIRDTANNPTSETMSSTDPKTGLPRGKEKWLFNDAPDGMDVKLVYTLNDEFVTAMPVDNPEREMRKQGLQEDVNKGIV